jgi:hypothetical protein
MKGIKVDASERFFRVTLVTDTPISPETCRRFPWGPFITQIDRGSERPGEYRYVFQISRAVAAMSAAELERDIRDFFEAEELRAGTHRVDTQHFPNLASVTVGRVIELARLGNRYAMSYLLELKELWYKEHREAVRDILDWRSVCPDDREHFGHQVARVGRRDKLIPWIEAALGEDFDGAQLIARKYSLT